MKKKKYNRNNLLIKIVILIVNCSQKKGIFIFDLPCIYLISNIKLF